MPSAIEFFFDFSSPYGYLASTQIEALGERHGRQVIWKPFLVGTAMKITGREPLAATPLIGDYMQHDVPRFARLLGVPFNLPDPFPVASVAAARAYYWIAQHDHSRAKAFAQAVYRAYFVANQDITGAQQLTQIAIQTGNDGAGLADAIQSPAIKQVFRQENDAAVARGVFGSPFIIVDGEPFWGVDRLSQVDRWLVAGGW